MRRLRRVVFGLLLYWPGGLNGKVCDRERHPLRRVVLIEFRTCNPRWTFRSELIRQPPSHPRNRYRCSKSSVFGVPRTRCYPVWNSSMATPNEGVRMTTKKKVATIWAVSGLLFALSGLAWTLNGNAGIGMMNIAVGMSFIAISCSVAAKEKRNREKQNKDEQNDEDSKSSRG
jgi:hypothetical protein